MVVRSSDRRQKFSIVARAIWRSCRAWTYDHAVADRAIALLLVPVLIPVLAAILPIALFCQGRPFLYDSRRMKSPDQEFRLWKIRTMRAVSGAALAVMGGDQLASVTKLGRVLRSLRLDEIPQIFNVLAGDIRFIGPRPPLRRYVEAYPEIYAQVLSMKPGITGLATVLVHKREKRLLEACGTAAETDAVYQHACIPLKARLDLLYMRRRSLGLDAFVIYRTFAGLLPTSGRVTRDFAAERKKAGEFAHLDSPAFGISMGRKIARTAT